MPWAGGHKEIGVLNAGDLGDRTGLGGQGPGTYFLAQGQRGLLLPQHGLLGWLSFWHCL